MINILLFAGLKERIGRDTVEWAEAGLTVSELKKRFAEMYGLEDLIATAMTAVNEEFEEEGYILKPGDKVAFIPPVSGG